MATNKLLPFANGVGANVTDYDTWSALTTLLSQGFTTGVARSDYANRVFAQGALASYVLGQFVVDQTAQDADLNESTFYVNFKNALVAYIKQNAVSLDTVQTVGGVKTFTSSPIVPTPASGDNSQKVASTAFVQGEIASKADDSDVVKLTGNQTIAGVKTFSDSPEVPTPASGDNSQKTASTGFVQNAVSSQAVKFDSAQTLTDAQKEQARSNIDSAENNVTPIGSYIYFAGSSVPDHYLLCNGAAVSRTDYADLYAVIGTTYGAGDGSTTFNLPNLIDKFLEGSGTSGTEKAAGLPNITGNFGQIGYVGGSHFGLSIQHANEAFDLYVNEAVQDYTSVGARADGINNTVSFSATRSSPIYGNSATVQPPALTALPCIRYE